MYRIAICDDDEKICGYIEQTISDYAAISKIFFSIEVFLSAEELLRFLNCNEKYDLIFLDIEMHNLSGIELGIIIRKEFKNHIANIVYVSSHQKYIEKMFSANPQNFISKPIKKGRIIEVLSEIIELIQQKDSDFFSYKRGKEVYRVLINDILYFSIEKRLVTIHMINGHDFFNGSLKEIYENLKKYNFFLANKSCLINYRYITGFRGKEVFLINDLVVPLGKNKYKELLHLQMNIEGKNLINKKLLHLDDNLSTEGEV